MPALQDAVHSLFLRTAHGIRPGLEVTQKLLEKLGNPHHTLKCIHVAGTNGKGSVCAMVESVLRASGFKTGLYTSPHLFRFNERFRVSGQDISDSELEQLIIDVEAAAGTLDTRPATFFEISTAMAFEYFCREKVDYAVIETGMGGRWDATNVLQPVLSVITRIDLDHAEYLGTEIEKIAWEKAGIIKKGAPVICGPMPVEAEAVIYKEAAEKKVPILGSDEAVFFQRLESRRTDHLLNIEASGRQYHNVRLPLGGSFQVENCGVAVAALEDLSDIEGVRLQMKKGLETVKWPGRFQMLSMRPPVIYDGAHNLGGARALSQTLEELFPKFANGFLFSFMKDKDIEGILKTFAPAVEKAWALTLPGDRAMKAEEIAAIGKTAGIDIEPTESPQTAIDWVETGKKRLVCFTGSLYLAEELKKYRLFNG
ncbi:MAG: dihydrofolate synthase / folylpolyglutamate synthase [Verrucomicrobiota bacterium]|jgi:dihydrofolate synthase/folylpolyglutamate synthase|nr:dihydrofolate synthase / folylpolyglutamate synthase [Verrucomicrobiota bacterium]MDK2963507.1 dihydrofolate synthase / folylpolyglutamate synthase [Verrucomicrobiota bacterium]